MGFNLLFGWVVTPYLDGLQTPTWMGCNPLFGWVATSYFGWLETL